MSSIDSLLTYFKNIIPLTGEEISFVKTIYKEKKVRRRQFILQEGDISKHSTFVVEGCFRMYYTDEKGKEHNISFAIENWWIGDIQSFYSNEPSILSIEAMENSVILQVTKEDLFKLYVDYPKFNRIFRVLLENGMVALQRRVLQNISQSSEERYIDFSKRHPQLFNRISNVQIASYLGVTPEFLSTIRKRITES